MQVQFYHVPNQVPRKQLRASHLGPDLILTGILPVGFQAIEITYGKGS